MAWNWQINLTIKIKHCGNPLHLPLTREKRKGVQTNKRKWKKWKLERTIWGRDQRGFEPKKKRVESSLSRILFAEFPDSTLFIGQKSFWGKLTYSRLCSWPIFVSWVSTSELITYRLQIVYNLDERMSKLKACLAMAFLLWLYSITSKWLFSFSILLLHPDC